MGSKHSKIHAIQILNNITSASFLAEVSVTPKIIYFHYLKKSFLGQSIRKNSEFNSEKGSTGYHCWLAQTLAVSCTTLDSAAASCA